MKTSDNRGKRMSWLKMIALGVVLGILELQAEKTTKDRLLKDAVIWKFTSPDKLHQGNSLHFPGSDLALKELAYGYNFLKYQSVTE